MQRYILFVLFLCLQWVAQGQTDYEYRYWFDKDEANMQTGTFTPGSLHLDVDLSTLDASLHTIHIQVKDSEGEWSSPVSRYFVRKATALTPLVYWLDNQVQPSEMSAQSGHFDLDVSALDDGIHLLRLQLTQLTEGSSSPVSKFFVKMPLSNQTTLLSWFDSDHENVKKLEYNGGKPFLLDVSEIADGFHVLYLQAMGKGGLSMPTTNMFIKIPQTEGVIYLTCACSVDGKLFKTEQVSSEGGVVNWNLDVASLSQGIHNLQVQVLTPTGAATNVSNHFFFRAVTQKELSNMKLVYSLDGNEFHSATGDAANGVFHFDVDVASLEDGLHRIIYQLASESGASTKVNTSFFWKTPVGGNGITQYRYWLNDNEANAQAKALDKRESPFSLVTLLPVDSEPIRSSCFQFEVKNGVPMMYAKNDFHIAFYDASSRRVDETKQFVDYNVSQKVEDIADLQSTQTFTRPEANTVKWYKFEGEKGDSVAFRSSLATSLQLFDSLGNVLYEADGSKSVVNGGSHLPANGIYYLAVHDVTATRSTQMQLDFAHIDKFDLFTTSKVELGVLPCVQIIELDGNGFDNLKSASLSMGEHVIKVDSIGCTDKSKARLYMKFLGEETYGNYDLTLNFDDGIESRTMTKKEYVQLTTPDFKEISIEITDPRAVADPYPVTIKLTNTSNISYQAIPFYFGIDHIERMQSVKFMDFAVGITKELYDNGMKTKFIYESFRDNNIPTAVVPTLIPELLPGESMTFTLGVKTGAHQWFGVYGWTGTPWNLLGPEVTAFLNGETGGESGSGSSGNGGSGNGGSSGSGSSGSGSGGSGSSGSGSGSSGSGSSGGSGVLIPPAGGIFNGCSMDPCSFASAAGDLAECACGTMLSLGGALGGIQNALQNMHNRAMRQQLAQSGLFDNPYDYFPDYYLPNPGDLLWYWMQHCLPGKAGQAASAYSTMEGMLNNPSCPDPQYHGCNPYNPGDPNEMHGYVSEAGSKYVPAEVTDVNYSIEFENNPEIANASAHKIVVSDVLDSNIFDLTSFKPTKVQIGEQVMELDGEQNFTKTMDMRPAIDAIAQISLAYDAKTGIAQWTISSLDPMTMEETFDIMQGVLPVNSGGNGLGFLNFDISLKNQMADGETFSNKAEIVFDYEDPIMTPVWTNTVDAVSPTSHVLSIEKRNDSILTVKVEGDDERSGVWKYEVYAQYGKDDPWWKIGECAADSAQVDFRCYNGIDYGFCVLATDSAGNVESKELAREASIQTYKHGDVNGDDVVNTYDMMLVQSKYLGEDVSLNANAADVNEDGEINMYDAMLIQDIYLSTVNTGNRARAIVGRKRKQQIE